ncbi:glycerate kinase [Domibacillus sp. A3M-37]|nr:MULTISPECIES: glycerate kinase [Domibacillus]MCP3762361.1 glycerate kinase [Domibacillus sp. A3M-37]
MKVLFAIDSFKGSISSLEGSKTISQGIKMVKKKLLPFPPGG